MFGLKPDCSD